MSQPSAAHNIIQIKVKLLEVTKPPVWRRLQLHADTRLDQLHEIIQAAFGWENAHLHMFSRGEQKFGVPWTLGDERRVTLAELAEPGARLRYTYDFGDSWEHEITIEDTLAADPTTHYPALIAAKGACPPEDCGGPGRYAYLREILADPHHPHHQDRLEWLRLEHANEFDPATAPTQRITNALAATSHPQQN